MKKIINPNFWKNKKVFVTGHTGFKGSWLCLVLKSLGAHVTGYSLKPYSHINLFDQAKIKNFINKSIIGDIRDRSKIHSAIKNSKATIIFHLAAQALVRRSYTNPIETIETNANGTLNILNAIKNIQSIKSAVLVTSDKVYDVRKNKVFKESDLLGGIDPYSASKVCCETIFYSYVNSFFTKDRRKILATARAGNVIGGGDYSEDRLIPDIIRSVDKNKKIIVRNPNSIRPWQHVLEPLSGYIILAEKLFNKKMKNDNQSWNFGPDLKNCKTVSYIAKKFSNSYKVKIKIKKDNKKNLKKETGLLRLNNNKAKKTLNWHPKWSLDESIKKIIEWHKGGKNFNKRLLCVRQIYEYFQF